MSIYEHGDRLRKANALSATGFDRLAPYEAAIEFVEERLPIWRAWTALPKLLIVRYEQLIAEPLAKCMRLAQFLGLQLQQQTVAVIVERYNSERASSMRTPHSLHFNKAIVGRWREVLSSTDVALCQVRFEPYLAAIGYSN